MLYKVVNIADKKLSDNIANILIYVYVWLFLTKQMLLVMSRLWVQRGATEVEQRRIWVTCHLCLSPLVSFRTYCTCSTHHSCLLLYLRGNILRGFFLHERKTDFLAFTHREHYWTYVCVTCIQPANSDVSAQSWHIRAAGWSRHLQGPIKIREFADKCDTDERLYACEPTVILYSQYSKCSQAEPHLYFCSYA